jgi:hypothetical protein
MRRLARERVYHHGALAPLAPRYSLSRVREARNALRPHSGAREGEDVLA